MALTKAWLLSKHYEFNKEYFNGKLMIPVIEVTHVKTYLGQYEKVNGYISTIRISDKFDRSERDLCQTLLHEMIHQYIRENHIIDTRPHHGKVFFCEADRINRLGGWNISRTDSVEGIGFRVKDSRKKFYICCFKGRDGRYFKFVMNYNSLTYYKNRLERHNDYYKEWFMFSSENDKEWGSYPECRTAVRGWYITKEEYEALKEKERRNIFNNFNC